eukprot:scaffold64654_cov66-Phaeocystis_antarctica.AAC.2
MLSTGATHFGTPRADGTGASSLIMARLESGRCSRCWRPIMARVPSSVAKHSAPVNHRPKRIVAREWSKPRSELQVIERDAPRT